MTDESFDNLSEQIEHFVDTGEVEELRSLLQRLHPSDIADLFPRLGHLEQNFIWDLLPDAVSPEVLAEMDEPVKEKLLESLSEPEIGRLVDVMESDDAADVVGALDEDRVHKVLSTLDLDARQEMRRLLAYDKDTAGGIMALEVASVLETDKVSQAIHKIRELIEKESVKDIFNVFIVSAEGVLLGELNLRQLILAQADTPVRELMNPEIISVPTSMDQEEVAAIVRKYDLVSVPVVDEYRRLVGRITVDDVVDVLTEEAEEDLSIIAGTGGEEPGERSALKTSRERLPWLLTGLGGGMISALVLHYFQVSLEQLIALAFFVPVITAMGGNTGIQSSSIVVRGLATGEISLGDLLPRIWKELRVALLNGLVLGTVLGTIVIFWLNELELGILIGAILLLNISIATLLGASVPIILKRIGADPALSMGPFVTTANDIIGLLIYLGLTASFLSLQ